MAVSPHQAAELTSSSPTPKRHRNDSYSSRGAVSTAAAQSAAASSPTPHERAVDGDSNSGLDGFGNDDDEFGKEMITAKIDPSGIVLWENQIDLTTDTQINETKGLAITSDIAGHVFVGSLVSINGFGSNDAAIVMYASDGSLIDSVIDNRPGSVTPYALNWIAPDQLLLTGSGQLGIFAASFDPAGSFVWSADVVGTTNSANKAGHIAHSDDGFIYFMDAEGGDIAVEQWSTDGAFQSRTRFDTGQPSDFPRAIAAGTAGHIYVVGQYEPDIVNRQDVLLYDLVGDTGTGCIPDLNNDGKLDFFDISAFLNTMPDMNGDGAFDFFDVSAFLNAFSAGCP